MATVEATEAVGRRSEKAAAATEVEMVVAAMSAARVAAATAARARAAAASVEASAVAAAAAAAVAADGSSGGGSGCCGCGCGCGCGGGGGDAAVTVVMAAAVAEMAKMAPATMAASWAASVASKEVVAAAATAARAAAAAMEAARVARVTVVTATAAAVDRTPTRVVGAPKELNHAALHSRCGPAELCSIVLPGWPEAARGPAYTWIDATRAWAWARARDGGTGLSPTIELHSPHVRRDAARPLRTAGDAVHIRETLCATRARWRHHFDRAANLAREVQPHAGLRQSPGARDRAVTGSWVSSMRWRHLLQSHPRLPQTTAQDSHPAGLSRSVLGVGLDPVPVPVSDQEGGPSTCWYRYMYGLTEKQAHPPTSAHAHPTYRFTRSGGSEVTRLTAVGARVSFEVVYRVT